MPEIVLTDEQVKVLTGSPTRVTVRGPDGAAVGSLDAREAALIAQAKSCLAANGPRHTPAQVRAFIDAFDAAWGPGPHDRERIAAFFHEWMRTNPGVTLPRGAA